MKRALGNVDSDVEDFFALLERIRQSEKQLGVAQNFLRPEAPAVTSKPAWHLSFEWEDFFSAHQAHPLQDGNPKLGNDNNNNNNICAKREVVCVDQKKGNKEMLDLNLLPSHFY